MSGCLSTATTKQHTNYQVVAPGIYAHLHIAVMMSDNSDNEYTVLNA